MALNDINFTEPNCIKEYLSQNILSTKEIFFISIKFSKITLPYVSLKDLIIQVEYQNKFYRYFIFSKKPLYLPYPNNINQKNKIKIYISLNSSIIGKGSFHINKENIKAKVFNKIIKINLSKEKLNEMGLIQKKGDITEINGTIFIEGNVINKNNLIKKNCYLNTNYNMNNSNNKVNSKSSYNIVNKEFKNNLKNKSKKIKKIKEEKILIGNKKRTKNKIGKKINFDLDLIDDNSIKFNYLSKKEFFCNNNNKNNKEEFLSFDEEKISKNFNDNINYNLQFYNTKINKYFNNEFINYLKCIKIKDQLYKNNTTNKEINIDLLKNISLNIENKEQKLNKIYQEYYNNKNKEIEKLKEKGNQYYKNYNQVKKVLKKIQTEYDENKEKYDKSKQKINLELQKILDNNNNYLKNKNLNELSFSSSSFKESDYFNNNKFISGGGFNSINNSNMKKNIKDNDLEAMIEILSSLPTDKIDILKGLTNLEKQDAIMIINSSLNKDFEEEKLNSDENEKNENDDSSEEKESNIIIQIIEKCVNSYYNKKLIPKIQIEQIDTYHYTFENLKVELLLDPDKENNLITSDGENFESWLVNNFIS